MIVKCCDTIIECNSQDPRVGCGDGVLMEIRYQVEGMEINYWSWVEWDLTLDICAFLSLTCLGCHSRGFMASFQKFVASVV